MRSTQGLQASVRQGADLGGLFQPVKTGAAARQARDWRAVGPGGLFRGSREPRFCGEHALGTQMSARDGIFAGDDPFALISDWMEAARATEIADPDAVALSTVDAEGMPNVRIVLMRKIENGTFYFFTNYESAKGQELLASGKASFVFHWKSLKRQIRVRGLVEKEDGAIADAYYAQRPLGSRVGAWASKQSRPLDRRATLEAEVERQQGLLGPEPSRPPFWGGFGIVPLEIEFWADGLYRLHDRYRWRRENVNESWVVQRLYP